MAITMTHQGSGWSITNNGEMTVSTPFDGYRMSKWSWSHENSAGIWKCHHELDVTSRQFVVDIDANHRVTSAERRLSAKIEFQTPANVASWLQNANAMVEFQHDTRAWKSSGRTNFQWGRYALGHEHNVDIEPQTALVTTAKLTTPFSGFEQLGIGLNNRRTGNTWRANNEVLMGRAGKVTLDGSLNYNGYNFDSMIRVTSPFRHLERIVANARNTRQRDGAWSSHADVQYATDKTMSVDSKLSLGSQKMIELEATTPFSVLRQMKYKAGYSGSSRSFRATTELEHNMFGSEKFTALISVDANDLRRMNGQLMIRTPFEELSSLRVSARHTQDSYEHMTTTVSWQVNQYQGSLLHDVTATSWADFDSRYELEYLNDRKIELTSSLHLDPKIVATATLRSPCPYARQVSFTFNQEGPLDNFKVTSELSYDTNKKITTDLEFLLRDDRLRTVFRLSTPFTAVDRFAVELNLSGRPTQFSLESMLQFNDQRITKTLEFRLHETTLTLSGNVETPFRQLRSLTYALNHNGDGRNYRSNLVVTYNGQEITVSSEFDGTTSKFELHTPWRVLRSYTSETVTRPGRPGWRNSWSIESDGQRYTGSSQWDWDGNRLDVNYVWNVPEEYSIRISHTGNSLNQFSNNVVVKLPGNQITGSSQLRRSTNDIDFQLNLASTFPEFERMEAVFKHEVSGRGFTTTARITTPFAEFPRMSTELTYQRSENHLSSQFTAETPFEAVQRLVVSLNHRGNPADFNSGLSVSVNDQTVRSTLMFKNLARSIEGSLNVRTPFDGYNRFHTSFAFNGEPQQFTASSTVQLPFDGYDRFYAELSHSGHLRNFRTNLEVRTPLRGYRNFAVGVEHEHLDSLKSSVSVQTPIRGYENFNLSLLKTGEGRNMQLKAELRTSVRRLERTAVNWRHNVNSAGVELRGSLETSVSPYERMALTFSHSKSRRAVTTNVVVETSIPGYSKFAASSECSSSRRNSRWSGSVETSVRGYERWTAGIEHAQGDSGDGFRTVVQMTTPLNNYNNFAATMSHSAEASQFRSQLRVNLPFREVPQVDVTFTHRGVSLRDFATALSVEYAGKKTELEMALKMGPVGPTEINYEGSFRLVAPCPYVRDFSITASRNRKPDIRTGALRVILNGDEKVCTVI